MSTIFKKTYTAQDFPVLYQTYIDKIFRFIYFKIMIRSEAQDICADVFLKVWKYLEAGNTIQTPQSFLFTTARNAIADYLKTKKEMLSIETVSAGETSDEAVGKGIEGSLLLHEDQTKILQLMQQLPSLYQEVIKLRYIEGYSIIQTAQVIEKSPGATRVIAHRAIKMLQTCLQKTLDNN